MRDVADGNETVRDGGRLAPLSTAQQRLFFLWCLAPDSPVYNVAAALAVRGGLAVERLDRALRLLRRRHEVLRTTFGDQDGQVVQIVHEADRDEPACAVTTVPSGELEQRRSWALAEARRRAQAPFDLQTGPLWRVEVLAVAPDEHLLALTFHHIVMDEVSALLFARELGQAYADPEAFARAAPPVQYADYCLRQERAPAPPRSLDYWRSQLAGFEPMPLPEDGSAEEPDPYAGEQVPLAIGPEATSRLDALCRRNGAMPFVGLLAAYFVLLQRWTGVNDLAVGSPVVGRTQPDLFTALGFFSNSVVLRCRLTPDLTFEQLLAQVRETVLDALEYQDVPFDAVVDAVGARRDPTRNPLFQVGLVYDSSELELAETWALDGLTVTQLPFELAVEHFGLTLGLTRRPDGLGGEVTYSRRRFARASVERFVAAYQSLLDRLCRTPGTPIGDIGLVDPDARAAMVRLGRGPALFSGAGATGTSSGSPEGDRPAGGPGTVWDLFTAVARRWPDREAVRTEDEGVTFAQLHAWTGGWAESLRARGVGTDTVVAIGLPRRVQLIAAMLAVWRAGGAFLLLDPDQPGQRQRLLLERAGAELVLVDPDVPLDLAGSAVPVLPAGELSTSSPVGEAAGSRTTPGAGQSRPDGALAYVVFTSGSTGQPKGVLIEQRGLFAHATTHLASIYTRLPAGAQFNVAALAAVSFDVFINQVLGMAAFGHRLLLVSEHERHDPLRLLARTADAATAVHVLDCTPSQVEALVDAGLFAQPHPPKVIIFGGETPSRRLWQRLRAIPEVFAYNVYGATECTIDSTVAAVHDHSSPVAGRPAGDAQLYVVDQQLQLLPPLFVGEICLGGAGVARGYVGEPGLTADRFPPDPFSGRHGARMYRTGDRGRLRPDGQLEFWGRVDEQLKIRGYRIEPGEIEAALLLHPGVEQAVVVASGPDSGTARLVAYLVASPHADPEGLGTPLVRQFLQRRLPASLLPDQVEALPSLPLTPHGKVDRRALRERVPRRHRPTAEAPEPRSPAEGALCRLFGDLLHTRQVGIHDNFFELGGNSLLAIHAVFRIATELDQRISVATLMAHPTVAELAEHLAIAVDPGATALTTLRPGSGDKTVVLVHPVGGTLVCYQRLARLLPPELTVVGCERVPGRHPREASLGELVRRYVAEIDRSFPGEALVVGGWSLGGVLAHEVAAELDRRGRPVERLELIDSQAMRSVQDHAGLRRLVAELDDLAARVREGGPASLRDGGSSASILRDFGITASEFAILDSGTAVALIDDWKHLMTLFVDYEMSQLAAPTRLYVCSGHPTDLAETIRESWREISKDLAVQPVEGEHFTILLEPAVGQLARAIAQRDPSGAPIGQGLQDNIVA